MAGFNIADIFERVAATVPDREALVAGERRLSYRALDERSNRLANHWLERGVSPGQHVAILAFNRAEWVEGMLAAFKLRTVPININFRYVEDELRYVLENADAVALLHERQFGPRLAAIRASLPLLRHCLVLDDGGDAAQGPPDAAASAAS
ncbi:MAG: AMP-binding protein [Gammaproteobacteria bacterium]